MVREIRVYVEGGGEDRDGKATIREGFNYFLRDVINRARAKSIRWQIIACGARTSAFHDFCTALEAHPHAFNVLLIDSEGPVNQQHTPWQHLYHRSFDHWLKPQGCEDEQCQLMVQTMEAWLVADRDALSHFYGPGFTANRLPGNPHVEEIERQALASALANATQHTQKGEYHKIRHGPALLKMVDVAKVRQAAPHCDRLFVTLIEKINQS